MIQCLIWTDSLWSKVCVAKIFSCRRILEVKTSAAAEMKLISINLLIIGFASIVSSQFEPANLTSAIDLAISPNETTPEVITFIQPTSQTDVSSSTQSTTSTSAQISRGKINFEFRVSSNLLISWIFFNPIEEICSQPSLDGVCLAYFPRFFFNSKVDRCEIFIYGGCGGNRNNFLTKGECESFCIKKTIEIWSNYGVI